MITPEFDKDGNAHNQFDLGVTYAIERLASILGIDPDRGFSWDAATEEYEGDIQSVICNCLRAKFGDEFWKD